MLTANPHELTKNEFRAVAQVERLVNHGRKWKVDYGNYTAFSDAETASAAVDDVHYCAVNNALYMNCPERAMHLDCPDEAPPINNMSIPNSQVLAEYPDLVAQYQSALGSD
uniref:hypothetical protein n=1 Tax=Pseudomonas fluorescens TaxID=294 RepID=UPI0025B768AB|nr:hypothetical protein [Pseudomonas fluorescens]